MGEAAGTLYFTGDFEKAHQYAMPRVQIWRSESLQSHKRPKLLPASTNAPGEVQEVGVFAVRVREMASRRDRNFQNDRYRSDGQGRIVGFHSLERELVLKAVKAKDAIKKIERKGTVCSQREETP